MRPPGAGPLSTRSRRARRPGVDPVLPGAGALFAGSVALALATLGPLVALGAGLPVARVRPVLEGLPDPGLPIGWSGNVLFPGVRLLVGTEILLGVVALLALGAVVIWGMGGATLLRSRGERLRGEYRLHRAVGASRRDLHRTARKEGWAVWAGAVAVGAPLGWWAGSEVARAWPGPLAGWTEGVPAGWIVVALLAAVPVLVAGGAARTALQARRLDDIPPPGLGALIPVLQCAAALCLLHTGGQLILRGTGGPGPGVAVPGGGPPASTAAFQVTLDLSVLPPGEARSAAVQEWLGGVGGDPGVRRLSLASEGTEVGIGTEDIVITQCGACSMANLPTPLKPVLATHHAVSPDTFTILGIRLEEGRGFTPTDDLSGEPVGVISRTLARDHFDREGALGRMIRVGAAPGTWVRVVGIVEDRSPTAPDASPDPLHALYLSVLQVPPQRVEVRALGEGVPAAIQAAGLLSDAGSPGQGSVPGLSPWRPTEAPAARALRWSGALARWTGWLALIGAAVGVAALLGHRLRERAPELGLRRALGARRIHVVALVLGEALGIILGGLAGGVWLVLLVSGLLGQWLDGLPLVDPSLLARSAGVLALAGVAGVLAPLVQALKITPAGGLARE